MWRAPWLDPSWSITLQLLERQNVNKYKNYESGGSEYLPNAAIIKLKHYFEVESSVAGSIMKYNAVTS